MNIFLSVMFLIGFGFILAEFREDKVLNKLYTLKFKNLNNQFKSL